MVKGLFDGEKVFKPFFPLNVCGIIVEEQVTLKIDAKGRICIPAEFREEIGDAAIMKKTSQGFLIVPGKQESFIEAFNKTITAEPKRKGKPRLATPEDMKSAWRTIK
jgi:bifunctional DNA-binding transcriptional regulator/antitoxin component of YhaV-PrlF toxin-antitoxin module